MRKMAFFGLMALVMWFGADIIAHAQTNPQTNLPPAIVEFKTETESLDLAEIESGTVSLKLAWQALNVTSEHRLKIEQYVLNEWVVVAGNDEDNPLPAQGWVEFTVEHPQNFTAPTYRLIVLDDADTVLTQRILVIPYAVDSEIRSTIRDFSIPKITVYQGDLANGTARVELSWTVDNRLPNTNLVFEQLMANGDTVNIELPRYELWIPSVGAGVVAPQLPATGSEINIRLQVVDMLSGDVHSESTLTLTIIPGTSIPPTAASLPSPAPPSGNFPQIQHFSSSLTSADRGDEITLSWQVTGAVRVDIKELAIPNEPAQTAFENAPLRVDALPFIVPIYASHKLTWILTATNAQGQTTTASVNVDVACPNPVDFTTNCPYVDDSLVLAYQPFEQGFMVWRAPVQAVSGDTRLIYIFHEDGTYTEAEDGWVEGNYYELPTPPEGLFAPERGFGYLFSTTPALFDSLGWATAEETGYQGRYVIVGFVHKSPDFMGYVDWIAEEFLVLPDQTIVRLDDGAWSVVVQ